MAPIPVASLFASRPGSKPRYRTGDIVKVGRGAFGTEGRLGKQKAHPLPEGMKGSVAEVAPFRPDESFPPAWIYKVKFAGWGDNGNEKFWVRGGVLRLAERNPKIKRPLRKKGGRR